MRYRPNSICLPALLFAASCFGCADHDVRSLNDQAHNLLQHGETERAMPICLEAVRIAPNDAEAHKHLGQAYANNKQFEEAEPELRAAIRLRPGYDKAYNNLGKALWGMGKYDGSVTAYCEAIRINPNYAIAYQSLAVALNDQGKTDEAIAAYRKAIELSPRFRLAYLQLGKLLHAQRRYSEADAVLKSGLAISPRAAEMHRVAGAVYRDTGNLPAAVAEWETTVALDDKFYRALHDLAVTYRVLKRPQNAANAAARERALAPVAARDYYDDGTHLFEHGRYAEAVAPLREAVRLDPNDPQMGINLGAALEKTGRTGEALDSYHRVAQIDPTMADGYYRAGQMLYQQGDHAGARAEWAKLLQSSYPGVVNVGKKMLAENP